MRQLRGSDLAALEREILLRGSMVDVARLTWHLVEKVKPFVGNWHIDAMGEVLTALYLRQIDNLRVSIPPGFMKSLMSSVFFPVFVWLRSPGDRFMCASFDGSLTARDSQRCIDIYESDWWQARVPEFRLKREGGRAPGKKLFYNEFGGWRMATSIGGKATGNHTDWLIVDDPTKPKRLTSVSLAEAENWWKSTASTRLTRPGKGRLLTMQRLHEKDLCGYVEQDPSFFHLVLPAHYNPAHPFVYGKDPRRVKGELLWPEYRDEAALAKLAKDLDGDREAQLEQNPRDESTRIFPISFFDPDKRWTEKELPDDGFDDTIISVDATFKDKPDSDDVAIAVISTKGPYRYLRKLVYGKLGFTALVETFKRVCEEFPEATTKLIEDKANGTALIDTLKKQIPGLVPIDPQGSKVSRAHACTIEMQTGFFLTPADEDEHPYMPFLRDQFTNFPLGRHDDAVDAVTQCLNWLRMNGSDVVQQLIAAKAEEEKARYDASQNAKAPRVNALADMLKRG